MTQHFIVATAGHVDHGKSALIQALTGTNPDRLPEEQARGITIDLGFAHLQLAGTDGATTFDLGLVDVPGHEDFVRNMVAGAGSIDLALLVVAADDGWMPQTEEHLQILSYLGVERAVVVLTKIDLAEGEETARTTLVREKLRGSPFEQAPIVPTSVNTGRGLNELKRALAGELSMVPPPRDIGKPRLPVDRAFVLQGIGTVVTGTLRGGALRAGQEVVIQPSGALTRIRSIQTHNRDVECIGPGTRTALNLANVSLAAESRSGARDVVVRRGCVLTLPDLGQAHDVCEVLLERSPRLLKEHAAAAQPLRDGTRVRFHTGSGNVPGRLYLPGLQELAPGERCVAQIRLEAPLYAFLGDRFVIRDWSERWTLAGGVVLDPCPRRKSRSSAGGPSSARPHLELPLNITSQIALASQLHTHRVLNASSLLSQSNFSSAEVAGALVQLAARSQCVRAGDWVLEAADWDALRQRAQALIDAHHKAHPEQTGLPLAELRAALSPPAGKPLRCGAPAERALLAAMHLPVPELFDSLIAALLRAGFSQVGSVIQRTGYRAQLPPSLQLAGAKIRLGLSARPLEPPARKELASDRASQEALAFLLRAGEVVEVGPDLVMAASAFAHACETVRQFLRQHGSGTVSELRQALGASRRVAVPLLEKLDRQGLTRREGDKRFLKAG